ncbi:MAG TPA: ribonuclease HI, partial [Terriglobales bacterium]
LEWFSIGHALREHNQEADRLANAAMDRGMGRSVAPAQALKQAVPPQEFEGVVRAGKVELVGGTLPDGTRVEVRVKRGG